MAIKKYEQKVEKKKKTDTLAKEVLINFPFFIILHRAILIPY